MRYTIVIRAKKLVFVYLKNAVFNYLSNNILSSWLSKGVLFENYKYENFWSYNTSSLPLLLGVQTVVQGTLVSVLTFSIWDALNFPQKLFILSTHDKSNHWSALLSELKMWPKNYYISPFLTIFSCQKIALYRNLINLEKKSIKARWIAKKYIIYIITKFLLQYF